MEEKDSDFGEEKLVGEGSEVSGVDDHQVFDNKPVRFRQFYFVKSFPLENPKADSMIKAAEIVMQKMNQDQILKAQKLKGKKTVRDGLNSQLRSLRYYHNSEISKCHRERLDFLHQSLDKLTFANNAYKGKHIHSCLSVGEVDKQKLSFLMVHGCKTVGDQRKLLREVNANQRKDGGMTIEELNAPIQHLEQQLYSGCRGYKRTNIHDGRENAVLKEIKQHKIYVDKAIASAAVNGKLWNSLDSKKAIQEELRILIKKSDHLNEARVKERAKKRKVGKKLEKVEKNIESLRICLRDKNCKKNEAYNTILELKKQYGEENACYCQYRSLMETAETLTKKKDIAAVEKLSQRQVEEFMQKRNNCHDFRMDYKNRFISSLNSRHLDLVDGRMVIN